MTLQGYFPMAMAGLSAVELSTRPLTVLAPPAQQQATVLATGCLYEILDAYEHFTPSQLVINNGVVPSWVLTDLAHYGNPAQTAGSAPIFIAQGTADDAVPYEITEYLVQVQLADYPQPVTYLEIPGGDHEDAVYGSISEVKAFITAEFAS